MYFLSFFLVLKHISSGAYSYFFKLVVFVDLENRMVKNFLLVAKSMDIAILLFSLISVH